MDIEQGEVSPSVLAGELPSSNSSVVTSDDIADPGCFSCSRSPSISPRFPRSFTSSNDVRGNDPASDPTLSAAHPETYFWSLPKSGPRTPNGLPVEHRNKYIADSDRAEWLTLAETLRDYDDAKIRDCKEDIDTLLVFAGLFSAILTAFNIESYQSLQEAPDATSARLLLQISQQLSNAIPSFENDIHSAASLQLSPFHVQPSSVRINSLWFSSLVCSLVAASLGMLVKQWLREYLSGVYISPQQRVRVRQYRYEGLVRWRVFEVAAFLPLLLQISLVLFFIGLSDFVRSLNVIVGWIVTGLIIWWLLLYALTTAAPIFWAQCPYKTPFLRGGMQSFRQLMSRIRLNGTWKMGPTWHSMYHGFTVDHNSVHRDRRLDIYALIDADKTFINDAFLGETIRPCLMDVTGSDVIRCVRQLLSHRLDHSVLQLDYFIDFRRVSTNALASLVDILVDTLQRECFRADRVWLPWIGEALTCVCSAVQHSYYEGRPIGSSMDRGSRLIANLAATATKEFMQEILVSLSHYPDVSVNAPRMTPELVHTLRAATQEVFIAGRVGPVRLCRVILSMACNQGEFLHNCWDDLDGLLSDVASAIERLRQQVSLLSVPDIYLDAQICLDHCTQISTRYPGYQSDSLLTVLTELKKDFGMHESAVMDIPTLIHIDSHTVDDTFLEKTVRHSLIGVTGNEVVRCLRELVGHRLHCPIPSLEVPMNFHYMSTKSLAALIHILIDTIDRELEEGDITWTPWMAEAFTCLTAAHYHSHFDRRAIGPAMTRCQLLQSKMLILNQGVVREVLKILVSFPGISGSIPLGPTTIKKIIAAARDITTSSSVNPLALCLAVVNQTASQDSEFLQKLQDDFRVLSFDLMAAIERVRREGGLRTIAGRTPDVLAFWCLEDCARLNDKHAGFAAPGLINILEKVQRGQYTH